MKLLSSECKQTFQSHCHSQYFHQHFHQLRNQEGNSKYKKNIENICIQFASWFSSASYIFLHFKHRWTKKGLSELNWSSEKPLKIEIHSTGICRLKLLFEEILWNVMVRRWWIAFELVLFRRIVCMQLRD